MPAPRHTLLLALALALALFAGACGHTGGASSGAGAPLPLTPAERRAVADKPARWVDPGPFYGEVQRAHLGEVLFSSRPVALDARQADDLVTTVALGDPLYVRFFADESLVNLRGAGCADPRYLMRARVGDGEPVFLRGVEVTAESARRRGASVLGATPDVATTTRFVLDAVAFGDPAKGKVGWDDDNEGIRAWNTLLVPRLAEGDNVVHVTVTGDCGLRDDGPSPVLAEGTLRVTVAPGAKVAYAKQYGPALPAAAHPESAAIVTGLSAAMAREWKDEDVVGGVVASEDWTLVRHRVSGAVLARDVTTVLVVRPKAGAHPDICRAYRVGAKQARTASGWASETTFAGVAGRYVEVPCDVAR